MSKVLTSIKIEAWILAALDVARQRNLKVKGVGAPEEFPDRVKKVTTRTWVIERLLMNYLKEQGLTSENPEVMIKVRNRYMEAKK